MKYIIDYIINTIKNIIHFFIKKKINNIPPPIIAIVVKFVSRPIESFNYDVVFVIVSTGFVITSFKPSVKL